MKGSGVSMGVDGDRLHAHPPEGGDDAAGNLAAIGDQDLLEHGDEAEPTTVRLRRRFASMNAAFPQYSRRRDRRTLPDKVEEARFDAIDRELVVALQHDGRASYARL